MMYYFSEYAVSTSVLLPLLTVLVNSKPNEISTLCVSFISKDQNTWSAVKNHAMYQLQLLLGEPSSSCTGRQINYL